MKSLTSCQQALTSWTTETSYCSCNDKGRHCMLTLYSLLIKWNSNGARHISMSMSSPLSPSYRFDL